MSPKVGRYEGRAPMTGPRCLFTWTTEPTEWHSCSLEQAHKEDHECGCGATIERTSLPTAR